MSDGWHELTFKVHAPEGFDPAVLAGLHPEKLGEVMHALGIVLGVKGTLYLDTVTLREPALVPPQVAYHVGACGYPLCSCAESGKHP